MGSLSAKNASEKFSRLGTFKILQKKFFDQAIIGGDTIFPLSLRLSGTEFSFVWD